LVANKPDLDDVVDGTRKIVDVKRNRRPTLRPEFVHGEEILDVVVEQLLKNHFGVVTGIDGPLTRRDSNDASVVRFLRLFAVGDFALSVSLSFKQKPEVLYSRQIVSPSIFTVEYLIN